MVIDWQCILKIKVIEHQAEDVLQYQQGISWLYLCLPDLVDYVKKNFTNPKIMQDFDTLVQTFVKTSLVNSVIICRLTYSRMTLLHVFRVCRGPMNEIWRYVIEHVHTAE